MAKYKVVHNREDCIGCGACVSVCPDFWSMGDDKKSDLKGAKEEDGKFVLELDEPGCNKEAAAGCPVGVISVEEVQ